MNLIKAVFLLCLLSISNLMSAQTDEEVIRNIYNESLTNGKSYDWLNYLSNQIGGRLTGSYNAQRAVSWSQEELDSLGLDKVWLQPVMVPRWIRGTKEYAFLETTPGKTTSVNICALGGSVATSAAGLKAQVVEVQDFEELATLGKEKLTGKIVFYNRPMQPNFIDAHEAYDGCVNQRYRGAVEAVKYGAVGVIVRSMNLRLDDLPHAGNMTYDGLSVEKQIPSAAISTNDAELLSTMLTLDKTIHFYFKQSCRMLKDVQSYNVIGEITGSEFPNEYIVVGGHLDSWDLGDGTHDDGAGVTQSMDVLRLFKETGIKPKRSIRVVLFMNKENGLHGARKYAEEAKQKGENHVFALESDGGGFTPRGFTFDCNDASFNQILSWKHLFEPYLVHYFGRGESGADVNLLKNNSIVLAGLKPDSQRYYDYQHASNDTFDSVNKRELELGAASMTALVYLFDKYGVK
jgi:hypothetical protein